MTAPIKLAWLIDDMEIDQRQYKRVITRSGLVETLQTFTYADEALEQLKAQSDLDLDLIFLDINMPRMNGFEFLEAANRDLGKGFAAVVVIMLTTSLNPADRARAESFDVVKAFINKPLHAEHLQTAAAYVAAV